MESDDEDGDTSQGTSNGYTGARREFWTQELQQSFREELEKLVILDYIMRNTDRGPDNWMVRIDADAGAASVTRRPPQFSNGNAYPRREDTMDPTSQSTSPVPPPPTSTATADTRPTLGAIDNSLSWPWKHPDAWRSYPFGWLLLPPALIAPPFSPRTRAHFLPLLTSPAWWSETQVALRATFERDADFQEKMFARQVAVMKGQAWNVVEALKAEGEGPRELCRRQRVLVWDDVCDVPVGRRLQRASDEMRARAAAEATAAAAAAEAKTGGGRMGLGREDEEMDITAHSTSPSLLANPFESLAPPRPAPQRSNTTRTAIHDSETLPAGPTSIRVGVHGRRHEDRADANEDEDEDDGDGDLGYAGGRHGRVRTRRVIVERLEVVKSKRPFFEWC